KGSVRLETLCMVCSLWQGRFDFRSRSFPFPPLAGRAVRGRGKRLGIDARRNERRVDTDRGASERELEVPSWSGLASPFGRVSSNFSSSPTETSPRDRSPSKHAAARRSFPSRKKERRMTFRSRNLRMFRLHSSNAALILGVTALLLAGCGETKDKPSEKQGAAPQLPASPTIATVGSDEIKAYELANEMRLAGVPMGKDKEKPDDQVTKRFMRELVQRKYLVQKAIAEKLDRDPGFLVESQRQRDQLLANMYLQRAVADTSLSGSRIEAYEAYEANHPLMFAKRQALGIEQIIFPLSQASKQVPEAAKGAKTLEEV